MQGAKGNTNFQETLRRTCYDAKKAMHTASVQANMEDGVGLLNYCQCWMDRWKRNGETESHISEVAKHEHRVKALTDQA